MEECQALVLVIYLIKGMGTVLPGIIHDDPGIMFSYHLIDHFFEETDNTTLRYILRLDDLGWFNKSHAGWVMFKNRISHLLILHVT